MFYPMGENSTTFCWGAYIAPMATLREALSNVESYKDSKPVKNNLNAPKIITVCKGGVSLCHNTQGVSFFNNAGICFLDF